MFYIIDGYNVLKQLPGYSEQKLKNGREGLVRFFAQKRPQGSINNRLTVVFDGREDMGESLSPEWVIAKDNIQIIFSEGESADDKIVRMVRDIKTPGDAYVVTDDRELRHLIKLYGANPLFVREFIKPVLKKPEKDDKQQDSISYGEQTEITEELEQIWLKNKS